MMSRLLAAFENKLIIIPSFGTSICSSELPLGHREAGAPSFYSSHGEICSRKPNNHVQLSSKINLCLLSFAKRKH